MASTPPPITYFAYVRKSTEGEERQALSIDSQKDKIRELFPQLAIVGIIEERHSAFLPHHRPEFSRMMERIRKGDAMGIVAWHPDRLSRNEIDAATITYMLRTGQLRDLKFGSYHFDNSPEGILMLQMALSHSQYSSAKLSKDVKRGLEKKVKMGWLPGVAPAGYLNTPERELGGKTVIKDPVRFPLVRKMWDVMLTGNYTPPHILHLANTEWGYRTVKHQRGEKMADVPLISHELDAETLSEAQKAMAAVTLRLDEGVIDRLAKKNSKQRLGEKTRQRYQAVVRDFNQFLAHHGLSVSQASLIRYFDHLREKLHPSTVNVHKSALVKCLKAQMGEDNIIKNLAIEKAFELIEVYKPDKSVPADECLTEDQIKWLIENAPTKKTGLIIQFLYKTGCRVNEMIHIRLSDCEPINGYIRIRESAAFESRWVYSFG